MRYIVLLALLLPVAVNAMPYNKADCEFLRGYFSVCVDGNNPDGGECHGTTHSARFQEADFMKRHSEKPLEPLCKRICAGKLSPEAAISKFCKGK